MIILSDPSISIMRKKIDTKGHKNTKHGLMNKIKTQNNLETQI